MQQLSSAPTFQPPFATVYYFNSPPLPEPSYVLDLSKKRPQSPDYSHCFPSPKSSPTYPLSTGCPQKSPGSLSIKSETSDSFSFGSDLTNSPKGKPKSVRPFKALPKDSLSLAFGSVSQVDTGVLFLEGEDNTSNDTTKAIVEDSLKAYAEFRRKMLEQIRHECGTNKNMRRAQYNEEKLNDLQYLEKRRKNNEAAKRSRDARRIKQDEIAIRVTFLEQENMMLKCRIDAEKEDLDRLRRLSTAS
ncbi:D site-binding protein-like [Cylas formicarius]|uniref:D site-binding protein-like n=1 Tax=Cylas formicarius TaxID=197179 RepID=UPI0029583485|nr:D site-binding protein-like [Cylas formicarius]